MRLAADGAETILTYSVDAQVGGKIAQLGGRLIEGSARKLSGQFFDNFAAHISGGTKPAQGEAEAVA